MTGEGMIVDIVFGFLGSGKTTFVLKVLDELGSDEKTVVLVNEFGDIGIDGELLADKGGNVVEMPSGCICCTLQADFKVQMLDIIQNFQPKRVIIEPTGVATIEQIRYIIDLQLFENAIQQVHNILIVDAYGFMGLYKANRHFIESQIKNAHLVILNKCDRVNKSKAGMIRNSITSINPHIHVFMTEFGAVDWAEYRLALSAASYFEEPETNAHAHHSEQPHHHDEPHDHLHPHFHEHEDALGYKSVGYTFENQSFNLKLLETFFNDLLSGTSELGEIVRAKGIFDVGNNKWMLMELASGEFSIQPLKKAKQSKIAIIGKNLNKDDIEQHLNQCTA